MKIRRRMTFQLTPLLDLLLIVIFAQSMEVRQQASRVHSELDSERTKIAQRLSQQQQQWKSHQEVAEQELQQREASLEQLREQYAEQFRSIVKQQQQAAQTLAEALNLPGTVVEQIAMLRSANRPEDAEALERAMSQLPEMVSGRGDELLQFLRRFDEMQKHVSIWELHLQENGKAILTDGEQSATISFQSGDEFVVQAVQETKAFSEPKPLVIVLLSYGDAQAGQRRRLVECMPLFMNRLRTDSGNVRWFDYSLMGFRASGPILDSAKSLDQ